MCMVVFVCLILTSSSSLSSGLEKEVTVIVEPGIEDCFYESVGKGESIDFEYQVIDGGLGDLDISFRLAEPGGRILYAGFKKQDDSIQTEATVSGDYRFCFDNAISRFNAKTIFFGLSIDRDEDGWGSNENIEFSKIDGLSPKEVYELQVEDIMEVVIGVKNHISKVRQMQQLFKSFEARDRNVAEENRFTVNTFSIVQLFVMLCVGIVQVMMVKSLFDDSNNVWKRFGAIVSCSIVALYYILIVATAID